MYRRNEREKEMLLGKLEELRGMDGRERGEDYEGGVGDSRVSEVEGELQKVKELFY